jgi:hypothetical protein
MAITAGFRFGTSEHSTAEDNPNELQSASVSDILPTPWVALPAELVETSLTIIVRPP